MPVIQTSSYQGLVVQDSLTGFFNRDHFGPANVIEYPRHIVGDYDSLAIKLKTHMGISGDVSEEIQLGQLRRILRNMGQDALTISEQKAAKQVVSDLRDLEDYMPQVHLRINNGDAYKDYDDGAAFGFHVDGTARVICNYNKPTTQWLKIGDEVPDSEMLETYGYAEYFTAKAEADIEEMKLGHMYHFLGLMTELDIPAFVHRGLPSEENDIPRLLLTGEYDENSF